MSELSHINSEGKANMVDVANKPDQTRIAKATGFIKLQTETLQLINDNLIKKGDVLTIAEIAGIQAAKETSRLIPLCHGLLITKIGYFIFKSRTWRLIVSIILFYLIFLNTF